MYRICKWFDRFSSWRDLEFSYLHAVVCPAYMRARFLSLQPLTHRKKHPFPIFILLVINMRDILSFNWP